MMRRRRPLLRAAAIGGTAYVAGKHVARNQDAQAQTDADQDASIQQLQAQQAQAAAPPPQQYAAPAPAAGSDDITTQLTKLGQLHNSGVLTDAEFDAAKQKILQG
jgi:hypothetical protein